MIFLCSWSSEIGISSRNGGKIHSLPTGQRKNKCTLTVGKCRGVYVLRGKRGKRAEETLNGPPGRHIKPLWWERTGLRNIKVVVDATYQARMS